MSYARFAIYYLPPEGALSSFGARWLGWDVLTGTPARHWPVEGLEEVTATPRKYGFHATLKPPFRLAAGQTPEALSEAVSALAARTSPAQADGLDLARIGSFLALVPRGDASQIARVAATCVEVLDGFRAPLTEAELARRRAARLSDAQEALLQRWGYPYVMEAFRFHMTLTGRLAPGDRAHWQEVAAHHLPPLPQPFVLDQVALVGERADGRFELIRRCALGG